MITTEKLKEFIDANPKLVQCKESINYPGLFVVKYKRDVFFDNLWDDTLIECRGLVIDKDYNIVVSPFTKIFNHFENDTDIPADEYVTSIRKVNGFLACATYVEGHGMIVSTTGSLDSDFVTLAKVHLTPENLGVIERYAPGMTFMFEICDTSDPHIIPEASGAYLIGARKVGAQTDYMSGVVNETWLDEVAQSMFNVRRPAWKRLKFSEVVSEADKCKHEGFVVYSDTVALKIKSPNYKIKKFMARKNPDKLLRLLDSPAILKRTVEEEFYNLIDYLCENKDIYSALTEQERLRYIEHFLKETI